MNPKKAIAAAILFALMLFAIRLSLNGPAESDQKRIERALAVAIEASREGRPGGVLDLLSKDLKFNDENVAFDPRGVADFVRAQKPEVVVQDARAKILGTEGRIVSPVRIKFAAPLGERTLQDVTLDFRKETGTQWGFIPNEEWRLVSVRVPNASIADFMP